MHEMFWTRLYMHVVPFGYLKYFIWVIPHLRDYSSSRLQDYECMNLKYRLDNAHHQNFSIYNSHCYIIYHHTKLIIALSNRYIYTSTIHQHHNITSSCLSHQHSSFTSIAQHHFIKPIYVLDDSPFTIC